MNPKLEIRSLICSGACLHLARETQFKGLLTFCLIFLIKVRVFFKFKSGNGKVNVLRLTLAQLLYTNRFFSPSRFLKLIILPFVLLCMEEIPFLARYTLPSVCCQKLNNTNSND